MQIRDKGSILHGYLQPSGFLNKSRKILLVLLFDLSGVATWVLYLACSFIPQVHRENKKLKRQSQLFVQSLSSFDVDVTKIVEATENLADVSTEDQTEHLNAMIEG